MKTKTKTKNLVLILTLTFILVLTVGLSSAYYDDIKFQNSTGSDKVIIEKTDGNVTSISGWFKGLFNWTTLTNWQSFDGNLLSFNETKLNFTGDLRWVNIEGDTMTGNLTFNDSSIINPNYIQFNITITEEEIEHMEGLLHWNSEDGTLEVGMPGGEVILQIGQESLMRVTNDEGTEIKNGQVVYISGAVGNNIEIKLLNNSNQSIAMKTIGVATEDITNLQRGYITTGGFVRDFDTSDWIEGDFLYISSESGNLTNLKPEPPLSKVRVAVVTRSHITEGSIFVSIDKIRYLEGSSNVNFTEFDVPNNSILYRKGDVWENTLNPTLGNITADYVNASILMKYLNDATYITLQDWSDTTQSAGKISGGFFTNNSDGSVNVSAGTGIIKMENLATAENYFFDWEENSSVLLIDDTTNYIYVDLNGGTPEIKSTTTKTDVNGRTAILLGKIFREGNFLHEVEAGMLLTESTKNTLSYLTQVFGEVTRASGYVIAETGERYLTTTEGVLWAGLTRLTTTSIDTSNVDEFMETYYRNGTGGWFEFDSSQVNNSHWDDGTGTLNTLTPNRYGVHWIYGDADGHLMILYSQGDYTLTLAEAAQPPNSLPNHISEFGFLAAKAIVKEGATNLLSLSSAYDTQFTPSGASVHNELAGLQGGQADEYFHLESSEHSELTNWMDSVTLDTEGNVTQDSTGWFNGLFNWTTLTNWQSFDGTTLSFNETKLNFTGDLRWVNTEGGDTMESNLTINGGGSKMVMGSDREGGFIGII